MATNRVVGGMTLSASGSAAFFSADDQSQVGNSSLTSSFGNSSNLFSGNAWGNSVPISGDGNSPVLNSAGSSGPSVGASSLVTDANSGLSGGPNLQRSGGSTNESYMRLPASPMSFSSNNISISGSPIMDGSSVVQQNYNQDPNSQQPQQRQQHQGPSSATSLSASRVGQVQFANVNRGPGSFVQDPSCFAQLQKKPRLDIKQEDGLPRQVLQQYLQKQDSLNLQNPNPQLQALFQQQRLRQQQHVLQTMPPAQREQLLQHELQLRHQFQQQGFQQSSAVKRPSDSNLCSRRLMQYLYHQRQRPQDNSIAYWRKFVTEYYSPGAKKRWCLSLYKNVGHNSPGVFPQAAMNPCQCDICGSKSGRGFEATFEVLPRLNQIKFGSGVVDELLFLDLPRECKLSSGNMVLEYAKAVQESVYEQLRVVHEGQLRIIFNTDLKIVSWEFCARQHEELLLRRLVAPQVNQLLHVAQKCQNTISEKGPQGISHQDIQANSNMVVTAGRQLARSLELQSLNEFGFSKRYVRCLQISEAVNSMKDLMDFCRNQNAGPKEGLKAFSQHVTAAKPLPQSMQKTDQVGGGQSIQTSYGGFNRLMSQHPGLSSAIGNNEAMQGKVGLNGLAQAPPALANYRNLLLRQSSTNSDHSSLTQEASSINNFSPNQSAMGYKGPGGLVSNGQQGPSVNGYLGSHLQQQQPSSVSGYLGSHLQQQQSSSVNGYFGSHLPQQQQMQMHSYSGNPGNPMLGQNSPQSSHGSQAVQSNVIQQFSHEMANNGGSDRQKQSAASLNSNGVASKDGAGSENGTPTGSTTTTNTAANNGGSAPGRNNGFKTNSNCESSVSCLDSRFNQKSAESSQSLLEEMASEINNDFMGDGFLADDIEEYINFDCA